MSPNVNICAWVHYVNTTRYPFMSPSNVFVVVDDILGRHEMPLVAVGRPLHTFTYHYKLRTGMGGLANVVGFANVRKVGNQLYIVNEGAT